MTVLFVILILIATLVLGLIVLIQNPKGGGLAGTFAGLSNQFMGVKQTTDVLEKGTWLFAGIVAVLSLFSVFFISGGSAGTPTNKASEATVPSSSLPANTAPGQLPGTAVPFDSGK